jgi:deazaflavin-dependent oxidoreductase (nitroreductase family)
LPFLYLTTKGWKTGKDHEIEIWYVSSGGAYYIVSEMREKSHWVQNIRRDQNVSFTVDGERWEGRARILDPRSEEEEEEEEEGLARTVKRLMDEEYNWSNGTIVELRKSSRGT